MHWNHRVCRFATTPNRNQFIIYELEIHLSLELWPFNLDFAVENSVTDRIVKWSLFFVSVLFNFLFRGGGQMNCSSTLEMKCIDTKTNVEFSSNSYWHKLCKLTHDSAAVKQRRQLSNCIAFRRFGLFAVGSCDYFKTSAFFLSSFGFTPTINDTLVVWTMETMSQAVSKYIF